MKTVQLEYHHHLSFFDHLSKIFHIKKFSKSDSGFEREGISNQISIADGLGLAIAKQLVELQNGIIEVRCRDKQRHGNKIKISLFDVK